MEELIQEIKDLMAETDFSKKNASDMKDRFASTSMYGEFAYETVFAGRLRDLLQNHNKDLYELLCAIKKASKSR